MPTKTSFGLLSKIGAYMAVLLAFFQGFVIALYLFAVFLVGDMFKVLENAIETKFSDTAATVNTLLFFIIITSINVITYSVTAFDILKNKGWAYISGLLNAMILALSILSVYMLENAFNILGILNFVLFLSLGIYLYFDKPKSQEANLNETDTFPRQI